MQLKQILITYSLALCLAQGVAAAELEGVKLADTARVAEGGAELRLNGAGVRTRFMFKVYVGALYLSAKTAAANAVINNADAKRIALHMLRELSSDQLFGALEDGLKNNHGVDDMAKLDSRVKQLRAIFESVKVTKPGDVILIDYLPDQGTRIIVNNSTKGVIPGADFNRALLRIWLGDSPADADLKKGMLGG